MQTNAFLLVHQMRFILEHCSACYWHQHNEWKDRKLKAVLHIDSCSHLDTCSQARDACLPQTLLLNYEAGADKDRGAEGQAQPLGLVRRPEAIV